MPVCDEATARELLYPHSSTLIDIIERAWGRYCETSLVLSKRSRANVMFDFMVQEAETSLAPREGIKTFEECSTPWYVVESRLALRFKMHDQEFRTRNYPTKHQRAILRQFVLDEMPFQVSYVSAGYKLDETGAELEHLLVTKWHGRKLEWCIDLRELADGEMAPNVPALFPAPAIPAQALPRPVRAGDADKERADADEESL